MLSRENWLSKYLISMQGRMFLLNLRRTSLTLLSRNGNKEINSKIISNRTAMVRAMVTNRRLKKHKQSKRKKKRRRVRK